MKQNLQFVRKHTFQEWDIQAAHLSCPDANLVENLFSRFEARLRRNSYNSETIIFPA
jgi:hypothetical protein